MDETSASAASLRFLLLGDVGVGKTCFINSFASALSAVRATDTIEEHIPAPSSSATTTPPPIRLPGIHITAGPVLRSDENASTLDDPMGLLPPKIDVPARELTFVTLPGYSSTINPSTILSMTDDYLNHHLHTVTSIFSPAIPSSQLAWFLIAGSRAHTLPTCAFYFVLYELKPIDILYMKMIHERVNLIPIIAKADSLSKNELWVLKKRMLRQLKLNNIKIHTFGSDMDTVESMAKERQWGAPPFVVSTRQDGEGKLLESELQQLVKLCLYDNVRDLQEDAARKVIAWKKAFGNSGNAAKTNVERVWSERDVASSTVKTVNATGGSNAATTNATNATNGSNLTNGTNGIAGNIGNTVSDVANGVNGVSGINGTNGVPTTGTTPANDLVKGSSNNPYFAHIDTRPIEVSPASQLSPAPYAPPPPVQQQPFTPPTPSSQYGSQFASVSNLPFTPPPSGNGTSNVSNLANPANFGLPAAVGFAPPPSFANGSTPVFSAPPSTLNKPAALSVTSPGYPTSGAGASSGLVSPPPSAAYVSPTQYVANTTYSPPPRTTSANATVASVAAQARMTLIHTPTGMSVDNSTRPSEIIDENGVPHDQESSQEVRRSFMENYLVPNAMGVADNSNVSPPNTLSRTSSNTDGNEVKVEIPNSGTSYQPSPADAMADLNNTSSAATQMQQQGSFILPGGFQNAGAFLIPPSDLYQAAIMSSGAGGAATNDYGEAFPDIWEAAVLGDVATVQMHLNSGVSPDLRNNSRSTLLHRTAWQGVQPFAVMTLLISYGANVNLTNENGNTVLQNVLMRHDDPSLIKLLLDNGAEAMIPNKERMNTLEVAALFNKLESARYLLENDLSSSEPQSITMALQRARSPDKKAMKTLLKSWQGKDGERKRLELMERLRYPSAAATAVATAATSQNSDAASVRSFETTKGDGKSSKWRKLKF